MSCAPESQLLKLPVKPLHLLKNNYQLCPISGLEDERLTFKLNITIHGQMEFSGSTPSEHNELFIGAIYRTLHTENKTEPGPFAPKQTIDCVIKVGCDY